VSSTMETEDKARPARARILKTAARLFYANGFHAVGVDTVVAESGVAKMTLYRHFPTKDDLVAAYLEEADRQVVAIYAQATAGKPPLEQIHAILDVTGEIAQSPGCVGCSFQACVSEFPDVAHPGRVVAERHKKAQVDQLTALARDAGFSDAEGLGTALQLVVDGAWVAARRNQTRVSAAQVRNAGRALLAGWPSNNRA
jgi:AcrR family transcriptional regulator